MRATINTVLSLSACCVSSFAFSALFRKKFSMVDIQNAELTALRALLEMQLAQGAIASLRNRADRLIAQQEESEQLLINVEATRNDPNVRIYRNSAILDADTSFEQAGQGCLRGRSQCNK
jgi:hypothetical protein